MLAHIDGQRALYITNDPYIKLFAEKECVSFEEAANILSEELYRIDDYRNQENMKDYELFFIIIFFYVKCLLYISSIIKI